MKIIKAFLDRRPDLTSVAIYKDVNVSGRTFQREGFQQMIEPIELVQSSGKVWTNAMELYRQYVRTPDSAQL